MSITAACPSCDQRLKVKSKYAGKRVKCPECSGRIKIPAEDDLGIEEEAERPKRRRSSRSSGRAPSGKSPARSAPKKRGTGRFKGGAERTKGAAAPKSTAGRAKGASASKSGVGRPKSAAAPKSARRGGLARSGSSRSKSSESERAGAGRSGTARRRRPAPTKSGGGFFAGMGIRIGIAVVFALIAGVAGLINGSAAYNKSYDEVRNGMTRAQVIDIMGSPDVSDPADGGEVLGFEAVDYQGRRKAAKHTFYFVILEGGKVVDKKRMTEEEFKRLTR